MLADDQTARPNGQNFHKETHGYPKEHRLKNSKYILYFIQNY